MGGEASGSIRRPTVMEGGSPGAFGKLKDFVKGIVKKQTEDP